MIRSLAVAAAAVGLMLGGAALAQQQQQRMPSSPPPQGGTTATQPSGAGPTMGTQGSSQRMNGQRSDMRTGTASGNDRTAGSDRSRSPLDSIASGLNACQLKPQAERQSCMDDVIRQNGG